MGEGGEGDPLPTVCFIIVKSDSTNQFFSKLYIFVEGTQRSIGDIIPKLDSNKACPFGLRETPEISDRFPIIIIVSWTPNLCVCCGLASAPVFHLQIYL